MSLAVSQSRSTFVSRSSCATAIRETTFLSRGGHGTILKFDRKHGYFGAYDPDGTVRTFFIPPEGVRYFEDQVAGGESRE